MTYEEQMKLAFVSTGQGVVECRRMIRGKSQRTIKYSKISLLPAKNCLTELEQQGFRIAMDKEFGIGKWEREEWK